MSLWGLLFTLLPCKEHTGLDRRLRAGLKVEDEGRREGEKKRRKVVLWYERRSGSVMTGVFLNIPLRKLTLLVLLMAGALVFYAMGGDQFLTYEEVRTHSRQIHTFIALHPVESMVLYTVVYVASAVLCLPGTTLFFTMIGGGLFGFWEGTLLAAFSSVAGAFLSFLTVRYLFRNLVARHFEHRWNGVKEQLKRHGVRYILALRFTSAIPYFILNPLLALTSVSTGTFLWTTAVGIFPTTIFYSFVGYRLGLMRAEGAIRVLPLLIMLPVAVGLVVSPLIKKRLYS